MSFKSQGVDNIKGQPSRASSRERHLTDKGRELREEKAKQHEKAFSKAYDSWKQTARDSRTKLKAFCALDDLDSIQQNVKSKYDTVCELYEPIRRNCTSTPEITKKMDACASLTVEICDLVGKRKENIEEVFNDELEKERVRATLDKKNHGSIFGHTNTETVTSETSSTHSSFRSTVSSKRVDAEAELAVKLEQAKATQKIQAQQARMCKLENEWKLSEAKMLAELKQKEAEMHLRREEEKLRLKQLEAENEVEVAAARVRVYKIFESSVKNHEEENEPAETLSVPPRMESRDSLNPKAVPFQPQPPPEITSQDAVSLAQAIASSLSISRLSPPEPTTFSGDPLKFIDWKISFMALIDKKPLPACEKMLYLKHYLAGEAHKAVEGFFYRNSEDAYQSAWALLQERYGNPFIVQRAFRDKLMKWPKISGSDPFALREFADFLKGCAEAMPHVKGLAILNDCEENHKLLKKLPDWIVRQWSRIVIDELDASGDYPSFLRFTDFIQREARIACNPIASPFLLNPKAVDDRLPKRANTLNTSTQFNNSSAGMHGAASFKPKVPCPVCKDEMHGIAKCPTFAENSIEDKKTFIRENQLCFGCLCKGHVSKDCKRRHTCNTCGRRHPTCLHEERENVSVAASEQNPTLTEDGVSQEVYNVLSHAVTQSSSSTSNIVPVFLSSVEEPHKEILTYALLDTQSDSTFILEDLLKELNVKAPSVQLKLSTMTAVNTIVASKIAHGLQIRGIHSETHVQLWKAYSRDFIPVDRSHVPTNETALQWPHLRHLADKLSPLLDCEVGLLIGYDCPSALAPLEVIRGDKNEPFAQRTELGWSITGSSNPHLDRLGSQSFIHRVAVKEMPAPSAELLNFSTELLVGDPEIRAVQVNTAITMISDSNNMLSRLSRFSSWIRLLKVVARIKRLASKRGHHSNHVTVEERERAAEVVIKLVQQQAFSQEMKTLERGGSLPRSSPLFRLDPIEDKGLLRIGGRLKQSSLSRELKHPVILPKNSHVTRLILSHYHDRICHQGRSQTQMELRANGFWLIGGSKSVTKLIYNCVRCRKLRRPVEEQRMAELPREQVEVSAPFTYCGMDVFGPFIIKRARKEYKRYGLILTCLSSRAVHIEMLEDLSTDTFISALRCFISLRGAVRQLHCDRGTNFVGARNELREALRQCDTNQLEVYLADKQCEFIFNAPAASHASGIWERQIRTVRNVLNATLSLCPGRLDDASLRTLFYEAMAIVNSRPLSIDGINDPTSLEPLTPNHLILMKSKVALPPPGKFVKEDMYATKRWRRVQYLIEQFWSRWKREYLLNISTRQKWHVSRRNLKVNDVVIIKDDFLPRNQWQLGRAVETIQGSDDLVRKVKVQVGDRKSSGKPSIIERPIQKLVLLLETE